MKEDVGDGNVLLERDQTKPLTIIFRKEDIMGADTANGTIGIVNVYGAAL